MLTCLLQKEFGVTRILLFGHLVHSGSAVRVSHIPSRIAYSVSESLLRVAQVMFPGFLTFHSVASCGNGKANIAFKIMIIIIF